MPLHAIFRAHWVLWEMVPAIRRKGRTLVIRAQSRTIKHPTSPRWSNLSRDRAKFHTEERIGPTKWPDCSISRCVRGILTCMATETRSLGRRGP